MKELKQTLSSIKLEEKGVYVQASTLGSLEALLEFLRTSKVPVSNCPPPTPPTGSHLQLTTPLFQYAGINIGPVHKKDVMKASTMLEHDLQYVAPPAGTLTRLQAPSDGRLSVHPQVRCHPGV